MMNSYIRGATAALATAALCSPFSHGLLSSTTALAAEAAGGTTAAMVVPATQIDAFGYAGSGPATTADTGSLVASSPLIHSVPKPASWSDQSASASSGPNDATPSHVASASWMPSVRALGLMSPDDLETKSLKALY